MAKKLVPATHDLPTYASLADDPEVQDVKRVPVIVAKETVGPVTFFQKVAKYYKAVIAFVGVVAMLLTQVGPIAEALPAKYHVWYIAVVGFVTVLLTYLKDNEHWVDSL